MTVEEMTPKERRFKIELSEDEMYQLRAVCGKFNSRHNHNLADLHYHITEALGNAHLIDRRWNVRLYELVDDDINLSLAPFGVEA